MNHLDESYYDDHHDASHPMDDETVTISLPLRLWLPTLVSLEYYLGGLDTERHASSLYYGEGAFLAISDQIEGFRLGSLDTVVPVTFATWGGAEVCAALKEFVQSLTNKADRPLRRLTIQALREMDREYCRMGDPGDIPLDDLI